MPHPSLYLSLLASWDLQVTFDEDLVDIWQEHVSMDLSLQLYANINNKILFWTDLSRIFSRSLASFINTYYKKQLNNHIVVEYTNPLPNTFRHWPIDIVGKWQRVHVFRAFYHIAIYWLYRDFAYMIYIVTFILATWYCKRYIFA